MSATTAALIGAASALAGMLAGGLMALLIRRSHRE